MTEDRQQKLFNEFPDLFALRHEPATTSCMAWGIECGDGWFDLLREVCYIVQSAEDFRFTQVKEKFGGLRLYYQGGGDFEEGVCYMAERASYMICERCGSRGRPNDKGWISTLCDSCRGGSNA